MDFDSPAVRLARCEPMALVDGHAGNPGDVVVDDQERQCVAAMARYAAIDEESFECLRPGAAQRSDAISRTAVSDLDALDAGEVETCAPSMAVEHPGLDGAGLDSHQAAELRNRHRARNLQSIREVALSVRRRVQPEPARVALPAPAVSRVAADGVGEVELTLELRNGSRGGRVRSAGVLVEKGECMATERRRKKSERAPIEACAVDLLFQPQAGREHSVDALARRRRRRGEPSETRRQVVMASREPRQGAVAETAAREARVSVARVLGRTQAAGAQHRLGLGEAAEVGPAQRQQRAHDAAVS